MKGRLSFAYTYWAANLLFLSPLPGCERIAASSASIPIVQEDPRTPERVVIKPSESTIYGESTQLAECELKKKEAPNTAPELEPTLNIEAMTLPNGSDDQFLKQAITQAKRSIEIGMYILKDDDLVAALESKLKEAHFSVNIVIDRSELTNSANQTAIARLKKAGAAIVYAQDTGAADSPTPVTFHHAKYAIFDRNYAHVMTGNWAYSSFMLNREMVVKINNCDVVNDLLNIFYADFYKKPFSLPHTPLVVSPINARSKISALLRVAKQDLWLGMQSLEDDALVDIIIERHMKGVNTHVMIADPNKYNEGYSSDAEKLVQNGVDVRYLTTPYLHEKVVISDALAFVGSTNFTYTALNKNREIGVLGSGAFQQTVVDQLKKDWALATPYIVNSRK